MTFRHLRLAAALALALTAVAAHAADRVDAARLMDDVRMLAADDMQGRRIGTPGGAKARAYIAERLKGLGLSVSEQPFDAVAQGQAVRGVNLVARVEGSAPGGEVLVVTAHYDHLGVRDGEVFNGADDNASGVAGLLAVAAALKAERPKHTVYLVALDGEEGGLRGARAFVAAPPVPLSAIALNVNFDMLSKNAKNELYVSGATPQPYLKPALEAVAAAAPVKLRLGHDTDANGKENNWTNQSDHYAFAEKGASWVYFGVEDHPEYHKPTDDAGSISEGFFVGAVTTVVAAVRAFDAALDDIAKAAGR